MKQKQQDVLVQIKEAFNSGDPLVRQLFLVRETYLPFTLCGIYILFSTVIGPRIMKNKRPLKLRFLLVFFNFCIVGTYVGCLLTILWLHKYIKIEQWCKESRLTVGDPLYKGMFVMWVIYIIKYIEFIDTVFIILRKKTNQLTFIHIMHHTLVPLLAWLMLRTERSPFQSILAVINAVTHVFMYTYYGLSAIGPQCKKYLWWKKHLTEIQLIQFVLMFLLVTVVAPLFNCSNGIFTAVVELFMIPLFFYFFYKFYKTHFNTKKESFNEYVIIKSNV